MSDITFSDGSTFEKGFTPPIETVQVQASTDRLMTEIRNGEEARTRQRQVEAAQSSDNEENPIIGEELCMDMINPLNPEEEIRFAIPTSGAMTKEDLERNKMDLERHKMDLSRVTDQEDQPKQREDPMPKLGEKT